MALQKGLPNRITLTLFTTSNDKRSRVSSDSEIDSVTANKNRAPVGMERSGAGLSIFATGAGMGGDGG